MKTGKLVGALALAAIFGGCAQTQEIASSAGDALSSAGSAIGDGVRNFGVKGQACALGGLAGGVAGGIIGNNTGIGAAGGVVIGGILGAAVGCSTGAVLEERRKVAADDAQFYDNQIALANRTSSQLTVDNANLRSRIQINQSAIARLQSSTLSAQDRAGQAQTALQLNEVQEREYRELAKQTLQEIEIQRSVLAELQAQPQESGRAAQLETQIAALERENVELEANIETLSAQNDTLGGFR